MYGIALLSKYPLTETLVHPLTAINDSNSEPWVMATAKLKLTEACFILFGANQLDAVDNLQIRLLQRQACRSCGYLAFF